MTVFAVEKFISIRFGDIANSSKGDFVDNQWQQSMINIFLFDDFQRAFLSAQDNSCKIFDNDPDLILDFLTQSINTKKYSKDLIRALIRSAIDDDFDSIIDLDESFEDKIYEASQFDEVSDYKNSVFVISSVSYNPEDCQIDASAITVIQEGEVLDDPKDLFGSVDVDQESLIGLFE